VKKYKRKKNSQMTEPYKSYVQRLLQNGLKTRRNYFSENIDARLLIEQSQRNVRHKTEQSNVR
jgi:hypothetical protein